MSHYCCAVFANTPDDFYTLLEPYNEENEKYFVFQPVDEEKLFEKYDTDIDKSVYPTFEEYADSYGYNRQDGVLGYMCNPNAKWDWYTIDGKDYLFEPFENEMPDDTGVYKKSQIDFYKGCYDGDAEMLKAFWQEYVLGAAPDKPEYKHEIWKASYYIERYGTLDQFIKEQTRTVPYAFVKPDGTWVAPGTVGWFAIDDATSDSWNRYVDEFDEFIKNSPDCYVTFADLHI